MLLFVLYYYIFIIILNFDNLLTLADYKKK